MYETIQDSKKAVWHYGLTKKELDLSKGNYIVVVDLQGLEDIKKCFPDKVISCFIDVSYRDRLIRAMARDTKFEQSEFDRRYKDDSFKFGSLEEISEQVDIIIENIDLYKCVHEINEFLKSKI